MNLLSAVLASILTLTLLCVSASGWAAARRPWVQFVGCRYVEQPYNDGDSFHVRCGEKEMVVRLYLVDAPETRLQHADRVREQAEYFGVTIDEALFAGKRASDTVREALRAPFVVWTRWASVGGRSATPRYLAFVEVNGQSLAELLVSRGLARIKGIPAPSPQGTRSSELRAKLYALEGEAKRQRRGVWATSRGR